MLDKMIKELAESVKKSVQTAIELFASSIEPRFEKLESEKNERSQLVKIAMTELKEEIDASIKTLIAEAVAALPPAKDGEAGKSVELADVMPMIAAAVKNAVNEIPVPKDGADGKSVTLDDVMPAIEVAIQNRFAALPVPKDGTSVDPEDVKIMVADAVAAIPTPKDGEDGKSVSVDQVKEILAEMVKESVAAIELPKPEDGRDAADLDIMPMIDEAKSYPRGLYATHRGGLWKSYNKTHGMKGWECIVDGVFKTVVNRVDERNFCFIVERASGSISKLPFEVDSTSYKKIFKEGNVYHKGDFVTWAGSLWHCNGKTMEKPGDGSEAWTLAAKKGRDYNPKVKV